MTTRHNFGFLLLDQVSDFLRNEHRLTPVDQGEVQGLARWETFRVDGCALTLFWPLTFMNLSGRAVSEWIATKPSVTEFPLGRVRIRAKGSSGGHNGLKSMETCLGHQEYPRIKLGIGRPESSEEIVDYVLCPFTNAELKIASRVMKACLQPVLDWARGETLESLAQRLNGLRCGDEEEPVGPE